MTKLSSLLVDGNELTTLVLSEELADTNLAALVDSLRSQGVSVITTGAEVVIPDPGLDAAIREALQKPSGPLTEQDFLLLTELGAAGRSVTNLQGLEAAGTLIALDLQSNHLNNLSFPNGLTNLSFLDLSFNPLVSLSFPSGSTNLITLTAESDELTNLSLPPGLERLTTLDLFGNQLTNLSLPTGLSNLSVLHLDNNQLQSLTMPAGLTKLDFLQLSGNQLTSLTLPQDMTNLTALFLDGNPLGTITLSEPMAAGNLAGTIATLRNQGVSVFIYPLAVSLGSARRTAAEAFEFTLSGPPGIYTVLSSPDLSAWNAIGNATNNLGTTVFTDITANLSPTKFYRVRQ